MPPPLLLILIIPIIRLISLDRVFFKSQRSAFQQHTWPQTTSAWPSPYLRGGTGGVHRRCRCRCRAPPLPLPLPRPPLPLQHPERQDSRGSYNNPAEVAYCYRRPPPKLPGLRLRSPLCLASLPQCLNIVLFSRHNTRESPAAATAPTASSSQTPPSLIPTHGSLLLRLDSRARRSRLPLCLCYYEIAARRGRSSGPEPVQPRFWSPPNQIVMIQHYRPVPFKQLRRLRPA